MLKNGKVAMQGGVKNYLGKKKTVTVPKNWQSSPDHPTTELAYITKAEKDLLLKKDLHNSLNGKPNRGPSGVMSLNGWGDRGDTSDRSYGGGNVSGGGDNRDYGGGREAEERSRRANEETQRRKREAQEKARKEKEKEAQERAVKEKEARQKKIREQEKARQAKEKARKDKIAKEAKEAFDLAEKQRIAKEKEKAMKEKLAEEEEDARDAKDKYMEEYVTQGKVKGGGEKKTGTVDLDNDGKDDVTGEDTYKEKTVTREEIDRGQSNFREQFNDYFGGYGDNLTFNQRQNQKYQNRIFNQARTNIIDQLKSQGLLTDEDDDMTVQELRDRFQVTDDADGGADYGKRSLNLDALTGIKSIQDYVDEGFYQKGGVFDKYSDKYDPTRIPGPFKKTGFPTLDFLGKKMAGPLTQEYLTKQFNNLQDIGSIPFDYDRDTSITGLMKEYEPNRYEMTYGENTGGGDNQPPIVTTKKDDDDDGDDTVNPRDYTGIGARFLGSQFDFTGLADGGRAGYMDGGMPEYQGGIMDLETGRQQYFLGKLVKKATRAIKKVAKSPFGKAALMYFGGNALMGGGGGGLSSLFKSGKGLSLKNLIMGKPLKFKTAGDSVARSGGLLNFIKDNPYKSILGGSALIGLMSGKEEDQPLDLGPGIDIAAIRANPYKYLAPRFVGTQYAADGGRMGYAEGSKEPVAKDTMPLLDMDGMEKDYREDGGFVPIGRMERADDVPARLSKNEFVFTADAVRNAGDGDIDKGAEVMYNMMKNLESGGEVSEESQGLDGAREMFQTSQRLEEVL